MPRTFDRQRQERAPLYEALEAYRAEANTPFHMPGHMQGRGAAPQLRQLMGKRALACDITQVLDMDDIHRPASYTKEAQELAAQYFGARQTWFLVNGSTCGNQAALLAALRPSGEVILPRCAHRSLQAGLILSGAYPIYASSPYDQEAGVSLPVELEELERLDKLHPQALAWAVTSVTPYGACAQMEGICQAAQSHGVPLLVDEAWGPHFGVIPQLPPSALEFGADCVVQSCHKLLGALSQGSMLHWQGEKLAPERLNLALRMLQSTSPSYLILVSLDLARRQLALDGERDWLRTWKLALELRQWLNRQPGFRLLERGSAWDYDPTRIVISALPLGIDGVELERTLRYRFQIQAEMSDLANVVLVLTPAHGEREIELLQKALSTIASEPHGWISREGAAAPLRRVAQMGFPGFPQLLLTPRQAYFSPTRSLPWEEAFGLPCAELITPYPPGIPLICPGERLEREHWLYLRELQRVGIPLDGLSDPHLERVLVCA